jgi:apolipoprotein N-acyltransferase
MPSTTATQPRLDRGDYHLRMTSPVRPLEPATAADRQSTPAELPTRRRSRPRLSIRAANERPGAPTAGPAAGGTRTARARTRTLVRLAGGAAAGVLQLLAFPPYHHWWLAPLAVAALLGSIHRVRARTGAAVGLVAGIVFFVPLLNWLRPVGSDAWLALAGIEAVLTALLGAALAGVSRLRAWPVWAVPVWIAYDALRARWPFGGFNWGRLGFAQDDGPWGRLASLGGVTLVTATVVAAGTAVAWLAISGALGRQRGLVGAAVALAVTIAAPLAVRLPTAGQSLGGRPTAVVAAIQGNVPADGMDAFARAYTVLDNHVKETSALAASVAAGTLPQPDAVIWPENAADVSPVDKPRAAALVEQAAVSAGAPLLVGTTITTLSTRENAGLVWQAGTGPGPHYAKRHLVPFGEYVPLRSLLAGRISRFDRIPQDFTPGTGSGVLDVGPVRLSDVMCFEVAYDGLVRAGVRDGGRIITVQSNNATYGAVQSEQQLSMARLRAMEHGRAVVVATTDGISAMIAPDGAIVRQSTMHEAVAFSDSLPLRDSLTLSDRLGGWPEAIGGWTGLAAVLAAMMGALRRRLARRRNG